METKGTKVTPDKRVVKVSEEKRDPLVTVATVDLLENLDHREKMVIRVRQVTWELEEPRVKKDHLVFQGHQVRLDCKDCQDRQV